MAEESRISPHPKRALLQSQERKLVNYLEDHFLDLTRNFKKRLVVIGLL